MNNGTEHVTVEWLMRRWEDMKAQRSFTNVHLQDIADYVYIHKGDFIIKRPVGQITTQKIYDDTAIQAAERLAAALYSGLTNAQSRWFALTIRGKKMYEDISLQSRKWLENATNICLNVFNNSWSGFGLQNHEFLLSLVTLGTSAMFIEDAVEYGVKFSTIHLSEVYILENKWGEMDTVGRKFDYTVRQCIQKFGRDRVHKNVLALYESDPDTIIEVLHFVMPSKEYDHPLSKHFNYVSFYCDASNVHMMNINGFYEMPYVVTRFEKRTGEVYGRGPAWNALPSIKMINTMGRDRLKTSTLQASPPLLLADDGVMMPLNVIPNSIIMGGVAPDGSNRVMPLNLGGNINEMNSIIEEYRTQIKAAFYADQLFFKEGTPVTATEAQDRQSSRDQVIAPHIGRIQTEYLNPLVGRVFSILLRSGKLGQVPQELQGKEITVDYFSPMSKAVKLPDIRAINTVLQSIGPLTQSDPSILDHLNVGDNFDYIADAAGLPAKFVRSKAEVQKIQQQRAAQQKQQQQLQNAQQIAQIQATKRK